MLLQSALIGVSCIVNTHGFVPNNNRFKIKLSNMNPAKDKKVTTLLYQNGTRPAVDILPSDTSTWKDSTHDSLAHLCPFKKVMAANRGEIAVRIGRAATELNVKTATIYAFEDRNSAHRWDSDESYLLPASGTPVGAYLNIENIITVAKENGVDAIHPGYGFLSESAEFAQACQDAGIVFIGPSVENLQTFGDKTKARGKNTMICCHNCLSLYLSCLLKFSRLNHYIELAINAGVSVVPGTSKPLTTSEEAVAFVEKYGLPIMVSCLASVELDRCVVSCH